MKPTSLRPFMPILITALMSALFTGRYDPAHAIALLTGLIFFFFTADSALYAAHTVKTREVHHYAIPLTVLRTYTPSLLALTAAWFGFAPFTLREFLRGITALAAGFALIWAAVWGISAHISRKTATGALFMPAIHYGLNLLMFITPVFYQLNAVHSYGLRTALGYNPLAVAILTARVALVRGAQSALPPHAFAVAATSVSALAILGWFNRRRIGRP